MKYKTRTQTQTHTQHTVSLIIVNMRLRWKAREVGGYCNRTDSVVMFAPIGTTQTVVKNQTIQLFSGAFLRVREDSLIYTLAFAFRLLFARLHFIHSRFMKFT